MSDDKAAVDEQQIIKEETAPQTELEKEQQAAVADYNAVTDKAEPSMRIKVHSPYRDYFDGSAFSITAENRTGPFDILPKHHNFISLLSPCEVIIRTVKKGDQRIRISGGIIHVKADEVIVFLDV
jgi:F-type H+-transporting ATPase subunit epsilon